MTGQPPLQSKSYDNTSLRSRTQNRRALGDLVQDTDSDAPSQAFLTTSQHDTTHRSSNPRLSTPMKGKRDASNNNIGQFLNESISQSWASVSGLASSLLTGGDRPGNIASRASSTDRRRERPEQRRPERPLRTARSWGPSPPVEISGSGVLPGSLAADREAALKAARMASVLESHDNVNGGLDVAGRHKRRKSDDVQQISSAEDQVLVYVHWVQRSDTYAGIILRYKCQEDAFRRANGLWSRDAIQSRKWLTIPIDACELRGRPCDPPSWHNDHSVDLLASTPKVDDGPESREPTDDGFFGSLSSKVQSADGASNVGEEYPWVHVRWVKVDSIKEPLEIGRVARHAIGYFPPRRRKGSIRTHSAVSTPRQSSDMCSDPSASVERTNSNQRPQVMSSPASLRARGDSGGDLLRPVWMRQPGGIGSMNKHVRAPGPDQDYFNTFTRRHIPGLNIEGPSMSIMGSETATLGFSKDNSSTGLVESPFDDGRDTLSTSRQGSGLDKAAAAVEHWLRGALAKRPTTPLSSDRTHVGRSGRTVAGGGDLIELMDTGSDDGRAATESGFRDALGSIGTSALGDAQGSATLRERASGTRANRTNQMEY